jgi:hypothetical protein
MAGLNLPTRRFMVCRRRGEYFHDGRVERVKLKNQEYLIRMLDRFSAAIWVVHGTNSRSTGLREYSF